MITSTTSYKSCEVKCTTEGDKVRVSVFKQNGLVLGYYSSIADAKRAIDLYRSNATRLQSFQLVL